MPKPMLLTDVGRTPITIYRLGMGGLKSPADLTALKAKGIKTLVVLAQEDELYPGFITDARAIGFRVAHLPLEPSTKSIDFIERPDNGEVERAVNIINTEENWPVAFGCYYCIDRGGYVFGNLLLSWGVKKAAAFQQMLATGFHELLLGLWAAWDEIEAP